MLLLRHISRFGESGINEAVTENRLLTSYDDFEIIEKKIDKKGVQEILEKKRTEDIQWLGIALDGKEKQNDRVDYCYRSCL